LSDERLSDTANHPAAVEHERLLQITGNGVVLEEAPLANLAPATVNVPTVGSDLDDDRAGKAVSTFLTTGVDIPAGQVTTPFTFAPPTTMATTERGEQRR
jgi:hypothetical protein